MMGWHPIQSVSLPSLCPEFPRRISRLPAALCRVSDTENGWMVSLLFEISHKVTKISPRIL